MAHLAFIFCCIVWGTSFILLERVTHVFGPVEIAIWRLFSGAVVVGFFWWLKRGEARMRRRDWVYMILASLLLTAPPQVIQAYVLSQGYGHSFFGTMVAAVPLLTILVSMPMLGLLPTPKELIGVLGGLLCMSLLVDDGMDRGMSLGLLGLTFLIPLSSAISNTFIKWKLRHVPAAPLTTTLLLSAGVALVPLEMSSGGLGALHLAGPVNATVTPTAIFYLFLLGVVASGLSTLAFIWMILKKGPLYAGMTTYVVPVLALLWGTVDSETISVRQAVAIGGVLFMVALVQSSSPAVEVEREADPSMRDVAELLAQPVGAEPQLAVVSAPELVAPTSLVSQPESQVA